MEFSKRSQSLTSSPLYVFFRKVKEAEAEGRDIISLGVGEPFQDTPEKIKEAGIEAIKKNKTHYNPAGGSTELRKGIAKKHGVEIENVLVSSGAKPFLGSIFWSLVNDGDVVFMAGPYYPPFYQIARSCGADVVLIDTKPDGFKLTKNAVQKAFEGQENKKVGFHIIINSPNNPSGIVYDKKELEGIVGFCERNNITLISDECYSSLSADPDFSLRKFSENVIVINSFSKSHAMTGWRVGYAVMPVELATVVGRFLENYIGCPSSVSDFAAVTALESETLPDFVEQRMVMHGWLDRMGIGYSKSDGGIFIFPDFARVMGEKNIKDSIGLATYFLDDAGVATTPGSSFGEAYDTHLRISYCLETGKLKIALERLEKCIVGK